MNQKTILVAALFVAAVPFSAVRADSKDKEKNNWPPPGWGRHQEDDREMPGPGWKGNPGWGWGGKWQDNEDGNVVPYGSDRCQAMQNRIDSYNKGDHPYDKVYQNTQERLDRLIDRINSKGGDTGELKKDVDTLKDKIKTLDGDQQKFIDTIKDKKDSVCKDNNNNSDFNTVRDAAQQVRKDRQDIRDYFFSTIRPELRKIRQNIPNNS